MRRSARLARSPLAYWLVVAVLALLTGMVAARVVGNAGALASRYGPLRPVVVAVRALEPGSVVRPGDVAVRQMPGLRRARGRGRSTDDGRRAARSSPPSSPGSPLVAGQLAPDGRRGLTALLPPGSRAVAVPNGRPGLALRAGRRGRRAGHVRPRRRGRRRPAHVPGRRRRPGGRRRRRVGGGGGDAPTRPPGWRSPWPAGSSPCPGRAPRPQRKFDRQQSQHRQTHHHPVDDEGGERPGPHHLQHQPHGDRAGDARGQHPPGEGGQRRPAAGRRRRRPGPPGRCRPRR